MVTIGTLFIFDNMRDEQVCNNIIDISAEDYMKKISDKESFILYVYSDSCKYCDKFKKNLDKVLSNNKSQSFEIEYSTNRDILENNMGDKMQGTPAVFFYINGEIKEYFVGSQDSSVVLQYLQNYNSKIVIESGEKD